MQGQREIRIILAHSPHKPCGVDFVDSRHQRYFNWVGRDLDTIKSFWQDLCM